MRATLPTIASLFFLACGTASSPATTGATPDAAPADAGGFVCAGQWVCVPVLDDGGRGDAFILPLIAQADGCLLRGLGAHVLLAPNGDLRQDGASVGHATGGGDSAKFTFDAETYSCRGASSSTSECGPGCGQ